MKNDIETLLEKRRQIEQKSELKKYMVQYVNSYIKPFSLNENGDKSISELIKKFSVSEIVEAVELASDKYLEYDNGKITSDSVENFINKISGILHVGKMTPIRKKVAYIKAIVKNRFGDDTYKNRISSALINKYVAILQKREWDEKEILDDLEVDIIPMSKTTSTWGRWKDYIEEMNNELC